MSRQLKFLIIIFALILVFLYAISDILLPFVLGITIAYLLDPVVSKMQKWRIPRHYATLLITLMFFIASGVGAVFLLPVIFDQLGEFFKQLPHFYQQFDAKIVPLITEKISKLSPQIAQKMHIESKDISDRIDHIINISIGSFFSSGVSILNFLSLILITPIVTFYMLRDWDLLVQKVNALLPQDYAPVIKEQVAKIDDTIASFIHGQLNVCILMAGVYGITLTLIGLDFGFIIGVLAGILIFIPFIGFLICLTIGVMVAYFQYPADINQVVFVALVFVSIHLVESNLISPRIIGGKIGIHPAWLIFGMLAGGSLLGVVGVIISVPLTAIIGVLVRFALEQYSSSGFYVTTKRSQQKPKLAKNNMAQHVFKFNDNHDYLPENFMVAPCNKAAFDAATSFTSHAYALNIFGDESSGKTYLAHIAYTAASNAGKKIDIIEDVDSNHNPQELLHLLNSARENSQHILLTSAVPVDTLNFKLADLQSRLNAINSVGIDPPDDELIYMMYARLFAAKQLKVSDDVIAFLTTRSARSFANLRSVVEKIDSLSLSLKKNISINLIKQIL